MNKNIRRWGQMLLVFILVLGGLSPASASTKEGIHYVALGDSLTAGQTPYRQWDKGYADFVADYLDKKGHLGAFTKEFAVSGYTSSDLLHDIETNKKGKSSTIQEAITNADMITIHVGANDFLREANFDYENEKVTIDPGKVPALIKQVTENVSTILQHILVMNPYAKVYVLGYYYPFPHLENPEQERTLRMINSLINNALMLTSGKNGTDYISFENLFDTYPAAYLPNVKDIHPSLDGYGFMASEFLRQSNISAFFKDVPNEFWAAKEIHYLAYKDILKSSDSGIYAPNDAITRADAASMLVGSIILDKSMPLDPGFKDVPNTHEAYYAIAKLTQMGIFQKGERFHPEKELTRAQMAKIFTLAFQLQASSPKEFKDIPTSFWAKKYVDAIASNHVAIGYTDGTFKPNSSTTRAQFAAFLYRSLHVQQ
ncbi:S-layer homology domain-containing protein [Priestia abyssalis]|uniref:S-layer homology domain-containing protein n=1 Tax=Priestia abyssalis TaxID=1221450 RepID=UPI001474BD10|nr:S-layer homology domain-containing protein [Priestia abyssalis]